MTCQPSGKGKEQTRRRPFGCGPAVPFDPGLAQSWSTTLAQRRHAWELPTGGSGWTATP